MIRWISIVNAYVFPIMNRFMKERLVRPAFGGKPDQEFIDCAREPLALQVRLIDEAVAATGFLVGDRLTIADVFCCRICCFSESRWKEKRCWKRRPPRPHGWRGCAQRPSFSVSPMARMFDAMSMIKQDRGVSCVRRPAELIRVVRDAKDMIVRAEILAGP